MRNPDDNKRLSLLPPHTVSVQNRLLLTSSQRLCLISARVSRVQTGRSFLKDSSLPDDFKPLDAVQWLQRALTVADQPEDRTATGMAELKVGESQLSSPFNVHVINRLLRRYRL